MNCPGPNSGAAESGKREKSACRQSLATNGLHSANMAAFHGSPGTTWPSQTGDERQAHTQCANRRRGISIRSPSARQIQRPHVYKAIIIENHLNIKDSSVSRRPIMPMFALSLNVLFIFRVRLHVLGRPSPVTICAEQKERSELPFAAKRSPVEGDACSFRRHATRGSKS